MHSHFGTHTLTQTRTLSEPGFECAIWGDRRIVASILAGCHRRCRWAVLIATNTTVAACMIRIYYTYRGIRSVVVRFDSFSSPSLYILYWHENALRITAFLLFIWVFCAISSAALGVCVRVCERSESSTRPVVYTYVLIRLFSLVRFACWSLRRFVQFYLIFCIVFNLFFSLFFALFIVVLER